MIFSEEVFITQHNFKKIIPTKLPDDMTSSIEDLIQYTQIKEIFNEQELFQFIKLWSILEHPEYLVQHHSNIIDKTRPETYNSYHSDKGCAELSKSYLDYSIDHKDPKIREAISLKIRHAFRDYTYENKTLTRLRFNFKTQMMIQIGRGDVERSFGPIPPDLYSAVARINAQYGNVLGELFDIIPNSGIFSYENLSLDGIESAINELLQNSKSFRNTDEFVKKKIDSITYADINTLKKMTGKQEKIWLENYKEPLSYLIQNYYWIKFNPELSVKKSVLDSLGFKSCRRCIQDRYI